MLTCIDVIYIMSYWHIMLTINLSSIAINALRFPFKMWSSSISWGKTFRTTCGKWWATWPRNVATMSKPLNCLRLRYEKWTRDCLDSTDLTLGCNSSNLLTWSTYFNFFFFFFNSNIGLGLKQWPYFCEDNAAKIIMKYVF